MQTLENPNDIAKCAVRTPSALLKFFKMLFSFRNGSQTFMRFLNSSSQHLDFVFVYIDHILVYRRSHKEHLKRLDLSFDI